MANGQDTNPKHKANFWVPLDLYEAFAQAVERNDLDVSKALRRYMREYVKREAA